MEIVCAGDAHLRDSSETIPWVNNQSSFLSWVKSLGLTKSSTFIHMGDFSDSTRHRGITNLGIGKIVKYLSDTCKEVYLIVGNHDSSLYSGSYLDTVSLYDNVKVMKAIERVVLPTGEKLLFLPHINGLSVGGNYETTVNTYMDHFNNEVDYVFGHHFYAENTITIKNDRGEVISSPYLDFTKMNLKFRYSFMGHCHEYKQISMQKYCVGAVSPAKKDEAGYPFSYVKILDSGKVETLPIDKSYFSQILTLNNSQPPPNDKDFLIIKVSCLKSQKYVLEKDIRSKYKNIYEIVWTFTDPVETFTMSSPISEDDLTKQYFVDNKTGDRVQKKFWEYYGANV